MDDRPRDSLGRPARRLRYPRRVLTCFSKDAFATLEQIAEERGEKISKIVRRAVMKDIYIWKAEKKKREEKS